MTLVFWMRNYSIRTRMLVGIAMALGLVLLVGAAGLAGLWQQRVLAKQFHAQTYTQVRVLQQVELALYEMRMSESGMMKTEKEDVLRTLKATFDREQVNAGRELQRLSEIGAEREVGKLARDVQSRLALYGKAFEPVARQLLAGGFDGASAADRLMRPAHDAMAGLMTQFKMLHGVLDHDARQAEAERDRAMWLTMGVFATIVVVAIAIIVPLTILNSDTITHPMSYACRVAGAIAGGDLSLPIRHEGRDESSQLLSSLASMQRSLRHMVLNMQDSSTHIQTAALQVMTGQKELSTRTEQTADNLQHTAANLSQMTASVRHTADNATVADRMAASTRSVASRGSEVVAEVVSTMERIHASSSQIAHIIGVIDEIAFQTNILALNAAVEAARAGEMGRGFAVVASEVRSLAQRSAEAASQVKQLIDSSVDAVHSGTRLVQEAGHTMTEIQASVDQVSEAIAQISAAATQQSAGMVQIDDAVSQLDQNTQLNTDLVRQSSRAAISLGNHASQLMRQVGTYQLHRQDTVAPFADASQARPEAAQTPDDEPLAPGEVAEQALSQARYTSRATPATGVGTNKNASAQAAPVDAQWEEF